MEGSENDLRAEAERDLERLGQGRTVSAGGTSVPLRSLAAVGIFVAVDAVVLLLCLLLFGPIGIAIGLFAGALAGLLAVRVYARRAAAGD